MGNSYLTYFFIYLLYTFLRILELLNIVLIKTDLIETTAKREFNKTILEKYFSSSDTSDVIAALLSVSHSEDTTFIKRITELEFYQIW
ncbi:MAG: hypothetical protein KatS3mg036_0036 [Ignavibacterium sp.]|nr:MAG: hypothetical protein KatS3mg036_0036 [Ignavibacterium sp.]